MQNYKVIHQGEDETAEEKEEGIEGILSDVLDDEAVIKATLAQVKSLYLLSHRS